MQKKRRRRRLSPELEKQIANAKRTVELISAKINDIQEEDIQSEYKAAFTNVVHSFLILSTAYDDFGLNDSSEQALRNYNDLINKFKDEYEI